MEGLEVELSYHTEGDDQIFVARTAGAEISFRWSDDSAMWTLYDNLEDMRRRTAEMVDHEQQVVKFRESLEKEFPEGLFD